jgi:hypothetical protein
VDANVIAERLGLHPVSVRKELSECHRILVPDAVPCTDLRLPLTMSPTRGAGTPISLASR